jgi:hypothetical protein
METVKKKYTVQQKFEVWYSVEVEASSDVEAMVLAGDEISEGGGWEVDGSHLAENIFWVCAEDEEYGKTYENGLFVREGA